MLPPQKARARAIRVAWSGTAAAYLTTRPGFHSRVERTASTELLADEGGHSDGAAWQIATKPGSDCGERVRAVDKHSSSNLDG
jgi:hypothetical protein